MRTKESFKISNEITFREHLLQWSQQFYETVWLESNAHQDRYSSFNAILGVDALTLIQTDAEGAFEDLMTYQSETKDWIFGYLSYDLKNDIEYLNSNNHDGLEFPELLFFQPKKIIKMTGKVVEFNYLNMVADEIGKDFESINKGDTAYQEVTATEDIRIKMRIFKDEYFRAADEMLQHIHRGDIYEANFCQEFYAENTVIDPLGTYERLNSISKPPFATFLKYNDKFVMSASPERYLRKQGNKIISQPIKGTARRSPNAIEDAVLRNRLQEDPKERAENIMIVDLVRNDLSKSALKGSVIVEELCRIDSYEQVHQMVSTKISAMKLIEELEAFKRGLYSGAIGYVTPDDNFDFNVVIRSILYNASKKYVSYAVGSALTAKASPEQEYEECLLKAKAMREVLENSNT